MKNNEKTFKFPLSKSEEPLHKHVRAVLVDCPNLISPEERGN